LADFDADTKFDGVDEPLVIASVMFALATWGFLLTSLAVAKPIF
jgi:hypothetical protein